MTGKQEIQAIISDLKSVKEKLGKTPSRDEYQAHGSFSRHKISKHFGGFASLLKASGLEVVRKETKGEKKLREKVQKFEAEKLLQERFKKEVSPFIGKYLYKPKREILRVAASSDHHSQFLEEPLFQIFLDHIKRLQPEIIALVGDVFDFWAISRYDKDPGRALKLQDEIDFVREKIFKRVRKVCPDSQIDFFLGNHEARLFKYLSGEARGLSSLRCLQFHNLFGLEDYKINLVARPSYLTPQVNKHAQNYKIYGDCFVLSHGESFGKHPAQAELERYNLSGASGHVHRNTVFSKRDLTGVKKWTSLGTMASLKVGDDYIPSISNWQQGYQIEHINLSLKRSVSEYVDYNDGFTHAGGIYYEAS